jgi:hypothetical protein
MKRLLAIGVSLLMLVGFSANAVAMSDSDKEKYLDWVLGYSSSTALAEKPTNIKRDTPMANRRFITVSQTRSLHHHGRLYGYLHIRVSDLN